MQIGIEDMPPLFLLSLYKATSVTFWLASPPVAFPVGQKKERDYRNFGSLDFYPPPCRFIRVLTPACAGGCVPDRVMIPEPGGASTQRSESLLPR